MRKSKYKERITKEEVDGPAANLSAGNLLPNFGTLPFGPKTSRLQ